MATAYTIAQSSILQCSSPLSRGDILRLKRPIAENNPTVDEILGAAYRSIYFWSRLKGCQACLKGRLAELLAKYESTIGVLQVPSALFQAPDPASNESREDPADLENTILCSHTSTSPSTTAPALFSASSVLPPMFLGELMLDHEQSLALLGTVYDDALKQLASILYEMRQTRTVLEMRVGPFCRRSPVYITKPYRAYNKRHLNLCPQYISSQDVFETAPPIHKSSSAQSPLNMLYK